MNDEVYQELRAELGESLEFNYLMSNLSKIGVGGVCTYYYPAPDIDHLVKAVKLAKRFHLSYLVIGQGSDIIPSDRGFHGLIIKNLSYNIIFEPDGSEVIVDSGVTLATLINYAASRDLGGLEFLSGYSGTVGGAIHGNYTFLEYSMGDFVKSITILTDRDESLETENIPAYKIKFIQNEVNLLNDNQKDNSVILTARIQLIKRRKDEILKMMRDSYDKKNLNNIESEKYVLNFFKNKVIKEGYRTDSLLVGINYKKFRVGGASLSKNKVNVIVNNKNAKAGDIRAVADRIREEINLSSNFMLEERVEYIGQW